MKKLYTLLAACALLFSSLDAQVTSTALGGSCKDLENGTLEIRWNALLNCPSEDITGITEFGFHSAAEAFGAGFDITWDDAGATTGMRNAGDTVIVTMNPLDYYGIAVGDMTAWVGLFNNGIENPGYEWDNSGRDTVPGGFGCEDLYIDMTSLQECESEDTTVSGIGIPLAVAYLDAFPNPANASVTLDFPNFSQDEFEVFISNSVGQLVALATTRNNRYVIERNSLPAGLYFATLVNAEGDRSTVRFQFQ